MMDVLFFACAVICIAGALWTLREARTFWKRITDSPELSKQFWTICTEKESPIGAYFFMIFGASFLIQLVSIFLLLSSASPMFAIVPVLLSLGIFIAAFLVIRPPFAVEKAPEPAPEPKKRETHSDLGDF